MSKKKHRNNNYNGQRRITGKDLQVQTTKIELKGLASKLVSFFSKYSFGVYLVHILVIEIFKTKQR